MQRALSKAARRGLDVRILTSGKSDVPIVRLAAQHVYSFFLKRGIRMYLFLLLLPFECVF